MHFITLFSIIGAMMPHAPFTPIGVFLWFSDMIIRMIIIYRNNKL